MLPAEERLFELITVALSVTICASHERVWRALVDPVERPLWDERILGAIDLAGDARKSARASRRREIDRTARNASRDSRDALTSIADSRRSAQSALKDRPARKSSLRTTKWRFRFGGVPLVMREEVLSADRHDRLDSRVSIGTMHFDQTLTFHVEDDETGPRTRLGMKIIAHNSIAVIGDVVPRLDVQKIVIEYVDTTLRQAQKYCEQEA